MQNNGWLKARGGSTAVALVDRAFNAMESHPGMKTIQQISELSYVTCGELRQICLFLDIMLCCVAHLVPAIELEQVQRVINLYNRYYDMCTKDE